jgi:hypothetical protein
MVRQAHTYLVGAMSGATLIAAAIATFVVLVSVQVFEAWPIAGLDGGGNEGTSSPARQSDAGSGAANNAAANGAGATAGSGAVTKAAGKTAGPGSDTVSTAAPGDNAFQPGGGAPGGEPAPGGGQNDAAAPTSHGGDGAAAADSGGGGGSAGGEEGGAATGGGSGSSTSGTVANSLNETVNQVDQTVTGGALEKTGVTGVTEEVVNGVLGPESAVGQVVDGVTGTVGGLLHPNR